MDSGTRSKLNKLQIYLDHLPDSLPFRGSAESDYGFDFFGIQDEDEEDLGLEGAVNRQLEVRLGHRNNGPVKFKERGPGLLPVVTVLENYLNDFPGSVILMKWLDDLICSAQQAFENAKHLLPDVSLTPVLSESSAIGERDDQAVRTTTGKPVQKLDSKILLTYEDSAYMDLPKINDKRGSGMNILPLLLKVSQCCQKKMQEKPTDRVRCIGSKGCAQTWAHPRNRQRILAHASKCIWLPTELREAALEQMADNAIGPAAEITPSASTSRRSLAHSSPMMAKTHHPT
ncbi:hypothetical protein PAXRUDRAFT_12564 [Paxillus rubicundulus Ve08.2h10]|uniref:Uncharacterized protein n=1 Tax=Paxillus rubicundulus Ve08.2h10 TaxID=930991 RepID=A0A0D0E6X4_9AGAM|nr:hypothetical protein PAXRUDRAFT_12564 [Paxillus rubicundulus Ve08.2h10]